MAINTHLGKNIDGGWIIYRDSDNAFRTVLTNASGGAAIDTSNTVFSMEFYTPGGSTPKLTLTEADGDIVNDDGGIIDYTLTQEDIATLPRDRYFFVIKYSVSGGDVKPLAQGYTNITSETNPGSTTTSVNMNVNVDGVQVNMEVSMSNVTTSQVVDCLTPEASTGTSIAFDKPRTYGYASAETGNFTLNSTGLVEGVTQLCIHNHSSEPTFPATMKVVGGTYTVSVDNYILLMAVKSNLVLVTISQEL